MNSRHAPGADALPVGIHAGQVSPGTDFRQRSKLKRKSPHVKFFIC
jgi:hypothetical protein